MKKMRRTTHSSHYSLDSRNYCCSMDFDRKNCTGCRNTDYCRRESTAGYCSSWDRDRDWPRGEEDLRERVIFKWMV